MPKQKFAHWALICALSFSVAFSGCSDNQLRTRLEVTEAMKQTLESIKDTASADAAAEKYLSLEAMIEKLPEIPKTETKHAEIVIGEWLGQIHRLEKADFYESQELKKALKLKE